MSDNKGAASGDDDDCWHMIFFMSGFQSLYVAKNFIIEACASSNVCSVEIDGDDVP